MSFFGRIREDIRTVVEKDPAARNGLEVLICYPGIWAQILHRPAHFLYNHNLKLLARIISQLARFFTGIEIHPGAKIGRRLFIDHGMGIVIGETTEIATLGNRVMVSSGAKVLGPFTVGDDAKIGSGAVVLKEVPAGCTVVGVPGRIVKGPRPMTEEMDQVHLPDPVTREMEQLKKRIAKLEKMLNKYEERNGEEYESI